MSQKLLQLKTSLFANHGQSSQLSDAFVAAWQLSRPGAQVTVRDFSAAGGNLAVVVPSDTANTTGNRILLAAGFPSGLSAQVVYILGNGPGGFVAGQYNLSTCTFCPEMALPYTLFPGGNGDVIPLPNGQVIMTGVDVIYTFDPPNPVPLSTFNPPGVIGFSGGVLAPNGNVYLAGSVFAAGQMTSSLYEFNPFSNTFTVLGSFPANGPVLVEIFYWNGVLYGFLSNVNSTPPSYDLASIQIGNPLSATVLYSYPTLCGAPVATISSGAFAGIYGGALDPSCTGLDVYSLDLLNNTIELECTVSPSGYPYGMGEVPPGFPTTACLCATNAGTILAQPLTSYCVNSSIDVPHNGNETLDNDDLLQYVLFANPADTAGSILATSNSPEFSFAPPMQTGVTYYVAAVAGNNNGGNVDLGDPCLDFSNANPVAWRPLPTVTFSVANPNVCAGACKSITAGFAGTPPFSLSYDTPGAGTQTLTASGNTLVFQLCPPAGTLPGGFTIQATSLADAWCTCP